MKSWFRIENAAADTAEISIYDVIGSWNISARSFISQLRAVTAKNINLRIHSPGGDVMEGTAIFNALQRHPANITTHIDGLAASMATIVALAGKKVNMAQNAYFMIHDPAGGSYGGTAEEHRKSAAVLDKVKETIVSEYAKKTGLPTEKISQMMSEETWMTAQEAKDYGFVDVVGPEFKAAAIAPEAFSNFRRVPSALRIDTPKPENLSDMKFLPASIAALLATATGLKITDESSETDVTSAFNALTGKVTALEGEKKQLSEKITGLEGEKTTLTNKVTTLEGEKKTLTEEVTNLKTKKLTAEEIAAQHGSEGTKKDTPKPSANEEGKKHYEAYQKAMAENRGADASKIWEDHYKAIEAHVATL